MDIDIERKRLVEEIDKILNLSDIEVAANMAIAITSQLHVSASPKISNRNLLVYNLIKSYVDWTKDTGIGEWLYFYNIERMKKNVEESRNKYR